MISPTLSSTRLFAAVAIVLLLAVPTRAQDALVTYKSLSPEVALDLARAALAECRKRGYQAAVAVVDRFGVAQVMLRDRFAGPHTPETATRKAWTAISFRTDTTTMTEETQAGKEASGVRHIPGTAMIGGGVMIQAGGELVGAIGVSGAPGGKQDDACARKGIAKIQEKLDFQ